MKEEFQVGPAQLSLQLNKDSHRGDSYLQKAEVRCPANTSHLLGSS